ncbi:MAG: ATP-dependent Clp protease ATP-binding subunit [Anaerolineae bacterium]|nr:ATP-dependent Clp protease ATP-binding subunit [Anaerolineae bacterium]MEB2288192.1 ATP-dependent Clp protease ATP-binding subunit [Anaerolineae bacterium]
MATLNPNLLTKDTQAVLDDAVDIITAYGKTLLTPEAALLALIRSKNTAAARVLRTFAERRGADLERLERTVNLAVQSRRDTSGDLIYAGAEGRSAQLSRGMVIALDEALSVAQALNELTVDSDHLLGVMTEREVGTAGILTQFGITKSAIRDQLTTSATSASVIRRTDTAISADMVAAAQAGSLQAVYFREGLLRDLIQMLSQTVNRHVILVGPDGVGKRALAYSLALLIAEGKGPQRLRNLVQIDERALLDQQDKAVDSGLRRAKGGILFIPHIHRFFGGQLKAEFFKAAPLLQKTFLGDDPVIIGSTTQALWEERLRGISAIAENSQLLHVPPATVEETIEVLKVHAPHIAADYGIEVEESALKVAATLARRYLSGTALPLSAEHLIHRAASLVSLSEQTHLAFRQEVADSALDAEDVTLAAAQMTGIPVSKLGQDERTKYASMVEHLHERIIGQDEAVMALSRAVKTARVGLKDPRRPIGSFLFLGPTGVGKTELAKALAEFMFGSEDAMLQLDMSEYMDENTVSRLIGAPPGYVGYEGGGQLTDRVREQPYIVVVFDEVEKAHRRVLDVLLQVMEEGRLTDGQGNVANFSEAVIIMTSNVGAPLLATTTIDDETRDEVMEEVRESFRPEFLNRIDEIVLFHPLNDEHLAQILDLMLRKENQLAAERGLPLEFTPDARQWMLAQNDHPEWGARPLRRIIQRHVRESLADYLLKENPQPGTTVTIDADPSGERLAFAVS